MPIKPEDTTILRKAVAKVCTGDIWQQKLAVLVKIRLYSINKILQMCLYTVHLTWSSTVLYCNREIKKKRQFICKFDCIFAALLFTPQSACNIHRYLSTVEQALVWCLFRSSDQTGSVKLNPGHTCVDSRQPPTLRHCGEHRTQTLSQHFVQTRVLTDLPLQNFLLISA